MRIAIISAGPSAMKTWKGGEYAWTLAVNMGLAAAVDADWLVAGDANCILQQLGDKRPRRGVWTMGDEEKNVRALWPGTFIGRFDLLPGIKLLPRPFNWSIQGAIALAMHLGGRHLDIYGCDMQPGPDAGGKSGDDRTEDRWSKERRDLKDSLELARSQGCLAHRITTFPWE